MDMIARRKKNVNLTAVISYARESKRFYEIDNNDLCMKGNKNAI